MCLIILWLKPPKKSFSRNREKRKKREVQHLLDSHSSQKLAFAFRLSSRTSGKRRASSANKEVAETTPTRANKFKKTYKMSMHTYNNNKIFSPEETLGILIDLNLTKQQYMTLRQRPTLNLFGSNYFRKDLCYYRLKIWIK